MIIIWQKLVPSKMFFQLLCRLLPFLLCLWSRRARPQGPLSSPHRHSAQHLVEKSKSTPAPGPRPPKTDNQLSIGKVVPLVEGATGACHWPAGAETTANPPTSTGLFSCHKKGHSASGPKDCPDNESPAWIFLFLLFFFIPHTPPCCDANGIPVSGPVKLPVRVAGTNKSTITRLRDGGQYSD